MSILPYQKLASRKDIPSYWYRHEGEPTERLFLHLGENPFPPASGVVEAISRAASEVNFYPDTNARALREDLAGYVGYGILPKNIVAGNGSDDLIQLVVQTFLPPGGTVVSFEPTFFYYRFCTARSCGRYSPLLRPRATEYELPSMDEIRSHLTQEKPDIVFLANPNNPTGGLTQVENVRELVRLCPKIVVIDECYYEFSGLTIVDSVREFPNLIILRSLSKSFGLAGVRIGYAVACRDLIEAMERTALTFPVNSLAQVAARAALREVDVMRERIKTLVQWRDELAHRLRSLGLHVFPSHTNFLLVSSGDRVSIPPDCASRLAELGILVSDQTAAPGMEDIALRIAATAPDRAERLIRALEPMLRHD